MSHWEQLNTAWGGTGSVGVFVARSLVKATSGSRAKERGDGSRVCLLYKQHQILRPHRAREALYARWKGCLLAGCDTHGALRNMGGDLLPHHHLRDKGSFSEPCGPEA